MKYLLLPNAAVPVAQRTDADYLIHLEIDIALPRSVRLESDVVITAHSGYEAIGLLMRWEYKDFSTDAFKIEDSERSVALEPDDTLIITHVEVVG